MLTTLQRIFGIFVAGAALLLAAGCTSYPVEVASAAASPPPAEKTYVLVQAKDLPGGPELNRAAVTWMRNALAQKDLHEAKTAAAVEMVIQFAYGEREEKRDIEQFLDLWYPVPAAVVAWGVGNQIEVTPFFDLAPQELHASVKSKDVPVKTKYLYLRAIGVRTRQVLWHVIVIAPQPGTALREILPAMMAASVGYIGTPHPQWANFEIRESAPVVQAVRHEPGTPARKN